MSRSPRVSGSDLIAALERVGFRVLRIKGSHHFLRHEHRILRDCQVAADHLGKLL